jgi:hypothetical protein
MTDEQINAAIAEACGWEEESFGPSWYESSSKMPNYCNDLNAMHEAEKALYARDFIAYTVFIDNLTEVCSRAHKISAYRESATASQRAEAFLKTINKWEGGSDE